MNKVFQIYRSSAGSGKTRTLAKEYLKLALRFRHDYFKHILAVTFTNKATQEMKDRILSYLSDFANNRPNDLANEIKQELKLDDATFQYHSQEALSGILHQYDGFHISTIDAFFQKVIRSFTRESGLVGDYRLEVEHDAVLEEVIDNLVDELGNNKELTSWVVEFAKENLENERAWDVRNSLIGFAKEIFREEFRAIEDELVLRTSEKDFFKNLLAELRKKKYEFVNYVKNKSSEALTLFEQHGLQSSDFKYAGGGIYSFFRKLTKIIKVKDFDEKAKGKRPDNEYQDVKNWPEKSTPHYALIKSLAEQKLLPLLNDILAYQQKNYAISFSAEVALSNFYAFGLIADITRKLNEYKDENNLMLLADAPKFLNGVIQESDTPFIYEKVGSFYRNYLIDEFQDTSGMQWKNFLPLLTNSLDQGYPSLVVGDVKQAIYRWRGGDLQLLQHDIEKHIGADQLEVKALDRNFRSAPAIVNFNNALFRAASAIVTSMTGAGLPSEAYFDVAQDTFKDSRGFVHIKFIKQEQKDDTDLSWKEEALQRVPFYLEELQQRGAALKDIAILVRKNDEGQRIAAYLLQYKNSGLTKEGLSYDVVSNESLRIDGAATVNLLVAAMKYLFNPDNAIARAQLSFEYTKLHEPERALSEVFSVTNQAFFEHNLPEKFTKEKATLKKLSLFELTETLIELFQLGKQQGELTYLLAFQDLVLDFFSRERNDLGAFLEWWEENKHKKSIQASGDINAAHIITIHKAKGLQFKYVIIPFCSWGLDHETWQAPNLWVRSDTPPFDRVGYIPVKYSSALLETMFSANYAEEYTRSHLDNVNLLYVALTRAEQGLIINAPHPENKNVKNTIAALLHSSLLSTDLEDGWAETDEVWKAGEWLDEEITTRSRRMEALSMTQYASSNWRNKLVIRRTAKAIFEGHDGGREKIVYGMHMHTVLSRIQYSDEVNSVIDSMLMEGLIHEDEKGSLIVQLDGLLANQKIAEWFERSWKVYTEVPILLPDGVENRIDRLIVKEKKAIVIDFKTGDRTNADFKQVREYISIIRKMNYIDVEGYLLYVRTGEAVSVVPGKAIAIKKKDQNQLGLGFA